MQSEAVCHATRRSPRSELTMCVFVNNLCRLIDEPLPTDLSNQDMTRALPYDFERIQEIDDRAHPDRF
eukprot:4985083-Amphidinium_carterae.1